MILKQPFSETQTTEIRHYTSTHHHATSLYVIQRTYTYKYIYFRILDIYIYIYIYTGCPRSKGPNFGRVFLRSNYTDITQNTYIQSTMVTEILAREKRGLLWCLRTLLCL